MNPLGTRAGAEELARLLDGAVAGPGSLSAGHAALAARLRAVAPSLAAATTPRAEFRAALRQRLVAVATVQAAAEVPYAEPVARPKALEAAVSWSQTRRAQRRIGVTAGAMAGVVALTGVGIAASRSLPGQVFYGLKTAEEGVELRFAGSETDKGSKHLEFASTRLREVTALAHGDGELALGAPGVPTAAGTAALGGDLPTQIADTLAAFDDETRKGQSLLESAYRKTGKPEPLRILTAFSTQQKQALWAVLPSLPVSTRDDAQDSLGLVTAVGADAGQLLALGTCGGECFPGNAGPTLPSEPVPAPGVSADPTATAAPADDNGVPPCTCAPSPSPSPSPAASPSQEPAEQPTPSATPTPTPTSSPTPSQGPLDPILDPVESAVPVPLPTITLPPLPVPVPTLPVPLPAPLASLLPTGLPLP